VPTRFRNLGSSTRFGTEVYEPPEAVIQRLAPRSRLYDIWSFGCIMLEFVIWLLYGQKGLDEFWALPIEWEGTRFWCRLPPGRELGARLSDPTTQIIDKTLESVHACQNGAIRDLLLLTKNKVLVPALHDRVDALKLRQLLQEIESKCKTPGYCNPDWPEHGARLPTALRHILGHSSNSLLALPLTHGNAMAGIPMPKGASRTKQVDPTG